LSEAVELYFEDANNLRILKVERPELIRSFCRA